MNENDYNAPNEDPTESHDEAYDGPIDSEERRRSSSGIDPEALARRCAELMIEKKGRDIVLLDVRGLTDITDFFVLCSADNDIHVKSIAENLRDELSRQEVKAWRTEGWQGMNWVILDYVEVVAHVFYHETRHFYKLERLWSDAKIEHISDDPLTPNPVIPSGA